MFGCVIFRSLSKVNKFELLSLCRLYLIYNTNLTDGTGVTVRYTGLGQLPVLRAFTLLQYQQI